MKTFGYILSTAGLVFLAFVAYLNATLDWHYIFLTAGVVLSIIGTFFRWLHYKKTKSSFWDKEF